MLGYMMVHMSVDILERKLLLLVVAVLLLGVVAVEVEVVAVVVVAEVVVVGLVQLGRTYRCRTMALHKGLLVVVLLLRMDRVTFDRVRRT